MASALDKTFAGKVVLNTSEDIWKNTKRAVNLCRLLTNQINEEVAPTPYWIIGRRGRCRLLFFHPKPGVEQSEEVVLLTPSLINRYFILDLYNGCSIVQSLLDKGIRVYLLDWGVPREQDQFADLEDHILSWMNWAVDEVRRDSKRDKIKLFGQCVGGTFATIYTALFTSKIEALALLTTPIDFKVKGVLGTWANQSKVDLAQMVDVWGNIKEEFLDKSFKMIHPMGEFKKKKHLLSLSWDDQFIKKYYAIEKWLKEGIPFPGKAYERFINDFYVENKLIKGIFSLGDHRVELENITCPVLNFWAAGDSIVPPESVRDLQNHISSESYEEVSLGGGHIGCVISDKHRKKLTEHLSKWADKKIKEEVIH